MMTKLSWMKIWLGSRKEGITTKFKFENDACKISMKHWLIDRIIFKIEFNDLIREIEVNNETENSLWSDEKKKKGIENQ